MINHQISSETNGDNDSDLLQSYVNIQDMRLDINRTAVLTDLFLTLVFFVLLILEFSDQLVNPITVMTRAYLKLPFLFCLWIHHQ